MSIDMALGLDLHIDGSESTVGDGAAHSAGEGEAGVERQTAQLGGSILLGGHCDSDDDEGTRGYGRGDGVEMERTGEGYLGVWR